jgi:beta-N-acetylhexosaminidase
LTELIRAAIGFNGLLMTDDLDMKALTGDLTKKTERALRAGCDIALQCSGSLADSVKVAKGAKYLGGRALERAIIAENCAEHVANFDRHAAEAEFDELMAIAPK